MEYDFYTWLNKAVSQLSEIVIMDDSPGIGAKIGSMISQALTCQERRRRATI